MEMNYNGSEDRKLWFLELLVQSKREATPRFKIVYFLKTNDKSTKKKLP